MFKCNQKRMEEKISTFSKFGDTGNGGITRLSLSQEANQAREEFAKRMRKIGAIIETDDMANMYATIQGSDKKLKRLAMASHIDSVRNGGNYDGILGVIGGMEVLETIVAEKIPHRHPVTAIVWTNEEGAEFTPSMIGSGVVTGQFKKEDMLKSVSSIDSLRTFGHALEESPYKGESKNRLNPENYEAMLELHVEQGPILEDEGKDIGVVTCVLGMFNYRIKFFGQSDHAGTTPMNKRQDALFAAAQAICYLHKEIDQLGRPEIVYTTGEIVCHPNVNTVIPNMIDFSIDVRHEDPKLLEQVLMIIKGLEEKEWGKCKCKVEKAWARETVYFNKKLVGYVKESADELEISNQYINSGAGHDAQYVSHVIPTTMIFVPSKDGHSHCELEYTKPEACTAGATVMLNALLKVDAE